MRGERPETRPVVLAAPSGAGKTTIARALVESSGDFAFSVSATTRGPREGEKDGVDYWFVSRERFREMIDAGEFAEWAEVHGQLYGTPLSSLREASRAGRHVILDIDVQGARQIRQAVPEALLIFILPPSAEALMGRLRGRGSEGEDALQRRLDTMRMELAEAEWQLTDAAAGGYFDHFVVNDDLSRTIETVRALALAQGPEGADSISGQQRLRQVLDDLKDFLDGQAGSTED